MEPDITLLICNDTSVELENIEFVDGYTYSKDRIINNLVIECYSSTSVVNYITELYKKFNLDKSIDEIQLIGEELVIVFKHPIIESYTIDPLNYKVKFNIVASYIQYYDDIKIFLREKKIIKILEKINI